jgi:predicted signal transduction protein with EAL and GGDEF domain
MHRFARIRLPMRGEPASVPTVRSDTAPALSNLLCCYQSAQSCADQESLILAEQDDDFGTGYSSLTRLYTMPIDRVRIDRPFVTSCLSDLSAAAIVESAVILARRLGKTVAAEGVETTEELECLRRVGADVVRGTTSRRSR